MPDLTPYGSIIFAAVIGLCFLIVAIIIYKLLNQRVRGRKGQRLGISEFHEIDKTRRIVLVRRDDVEHLVLIGGNQDVVIESGIETGLVSGAPRAPRRMNEDPPMRPLKPAIFGGRRPNLRSVEPMMGPDDGEDNVS